MTTAADDSAVEDAFEALLANRPAPEGAAGLAAFTEAVRASATRPGRPNAALAELLVTGLLTDQSSPSTRTARAAGSPPARQPSRVRIRRRTAMIFPVLLAKFLSAGAVAQAATGAGVVLVAVTGVGAAGALPGSAQDTFAAVVATVTPLEAPTSTGTGDGTDGSVPEETLPETVPVTLPDEGGATDEGVVDVAAWIEAGPAGHESFGAWVSASAQDDRLRAALRAEGRNFGSVISGWARDKGLDAADLAAEGVHLDELTDESTAPASGGVAGDVAVTERADSGATTEARGPSGKGNASTPGGSDAAKAKAKADAGAGNGGNGGGGRGNGKD